MYCLTKIYMIMKTYESESVFVNNFAKDAKESLKNGQKFEAEFNGIAIVVTNMDNNNASKVTMYQGTINGVAFKGNITALKKRLNIAWTKEYNRTNEGARAAKTVVAIKTDEELQATAERENVRFIDAVKLVLRTARKYSFETLLSVDNIANIDRDGVIVDTDGTTVSTFDCIMDILKVQRDAAKRDAEEREAEKEAERERIEKNVQYYTEQLASATEKGDMDNVITFAKKLKEYKAALAKLTK